MLTEDAEFTEGETSLPEEWCKRAGVLALRYQILEAKHQFCRKHRHPNHNCAVLRTVLALAFSQDGILGAGTKRQVTFRVACILHKRGPPDGPCMHALRESQKKSVRLPMHAHMRRSWSAALQLYSLQRINEFLGTSWKISSNQ